MGDFLDELIADGEKEHPGFSKMVDDAYRRRQKNRNKLSSKETANSGALKKTGDQVNEVPHQE